TLVAIMDADRQGFLRSATTLIQIIGRTARNIDGRVIMFGDRITPAMKEAIDETDRRRERQLEYNREHGIEPATIVKDIEDFLPAESDDLEELDSIIESTADPRQVVDELFEAMEEAAEKLEFEKAARLRDKIEEINGGFVDV
ncbi:MAG: UvrB/UvrC motif-containing protein, partial [bacterium]